MIYLDESTTIEEQANVDESAVVAEGGRSRLLNQSRHSAEYSGDKSKGKNRYERRKLSKISSSNDEYNKIDMNKFFKEDVMDFGVAVKGETDDYVVQISFSGLLKEIQKQVGISGDFDFRTCMKSVSIAFNRTDKVFVRCNCPDFKYRIAYFLSVKDLINGDKELRPSKETNPDDTCGDGCKHIMLVLANTSWLIKLASTIYNYVRYVEKHDNKAYEKIIGPVLYAQKLWDIPEPTDDDEEEGENKEEQENSTDQQSDNNENNPVEEDLSQLLG